MTTSRRCSPNNFAMHDLSVTAPSSIAAALALVPEQVPELYSWAADLAPIVAAGKVGRGQRIEALAAARGVPAKTVRKKFDLFDKLGVVGLINRKHASQLWQSEQPRGLSEPDRELVKLWCESYQRSTETALEALRRAWLEQRITPEQAQRGLTVPHTDTPLDPLRGYPVGWSVRNLSNYAPSTVELAAARIGRSAARSQAPLVYRTRANLYVGQFFLFDDIWHDNEVVDLDQRKRGRPLEFHGLDLASGCKFVWGSRTRIETEFKHEGLKSSDFRFVLASALTGTGYHPTRGTTIVCEHATAAVPEEIERMLYDATGGMIRVHRGGMEGAAAHAGQYAGRSKGNFKVKAALESIGNPIHNELSYLPGQVGKDRDHCPEESNDGGRFLAVEDGRPLASYGRQKYNDALLVALSELPPERARWLTWDYCTIQQFRLICEEIYGRMNRRWKHDLEGWDERYVPDLRTGKMRRLSPWEIFAPARRPLGPIDLATTALLLGHEGGAERTVIGHMITVHCGEVSGDELRFNATGLLPDREKFLTVLNPFDAGRLFCYAANGRFVAALPRLHSVDPGDADAVHRACGAAEKNFAAVIAPLRRRHALEGRRRAAALESNARLIAGQPATEAERIAAHDAERRDASARRLGAALRDEVFSAPERPAVGGADAAEPAIEVLTSNPNPNPPLIESW